MTILYCYYEPENWHDVFTHQFITQWMDSRLDVLKEFNWLVKHSNMPSAKLTSTDILRKMRLTMPATRGKNGNSKHTGNGDNKSEVFGSNIKWLNIKLEPTDIAELEQSEATHEFLAARIVALASDGYGVSIKAIDRGKSYSCTVIRPGDGSGSDAYGLSGFGGTVRDAILVTLYKFEYYLQGDFGNAEQYLQITEPRSRFR